MSVAATDRHRAGPTRSGLVMACEGRCGGLGGCRQRWAWARVADVVVGEPAAEIEDRVGGPAYGAFAHPVGVGEALDERDRFGAGRAERSQERVARHVFVALALMQGPRPAGVEHRHAVAV